MIFILDGPDGTGKTTLANHMVERLGGKYLHLTYRWKNKIFDYHTAAIRWALKQSVPVVIDRWWPSEAVYAKAFRGGSAWPMQGRMCERLALKHGVMYVLCLPESRQAAEEQHARLKEEREEMYDNIGDVAQLYLDLFNGNIEHEDKGQYIDQVIRTGGMQRQDNVLSYSIQQHGHALDWYTDRCVEISQDYRKLQYPPALLFEEQNILGHVLTAQYVLVGDQSVKHRVAWPFYGDDNTAKLVHNLSLMESRLMWANAYNSDLTENIHLRGVFEHKPSLKFISLSPTATNVLERNHIPVHAELWEPKTEHEYLEVFKYAIS
jgi:thymidylate kinase